MTYKGRFRQLLYGIWWQEDFLWDGESSSKKADICSEISLKNVTKK